MAHVSCGGPKDREDSTGETTKYGEFKHIRVVLFRECRFKERQLLFDSLSVPNQPKNDYKKYSGKTEADGNGGISNRPLVRENSEEFSHLTDLIFGSTAMKYQETYYKVHNISSPERIIFTQVFIPHRRRSLKKSSRLSSPKSKLLELQNSDSSSSKSDISSYDSFSIFRRDSIPTPNSTSTTMDSGFSELSMASNSSSRLFESRRSSCEASDNSLAPHNFPRDHCLGYSKLGLALIVAVGTENDTYMRNISFVESILTRLRHYVEIALSSPTYFISILFEISKDSAMWLLNLTNDMNIWTKEDTKCKPRRLWPPFNFPLSIFPKRKIIDQEFVDFCKVIEEYETKETNFFLSKLLTSVLAHHTGWIGTCYEPPQRLKLNSSYHAAWMQITNLQGSTGYLTKSSKTVVYGLKSENVIKRLLSFLRHFIRYFRVQRRYVEREDIEGENKLVDAICERAKNRHSNVQEKPSKKMRKSKAFGMDLSKMVSPEEEIEEDIEDDDVDKSVIFILGDDEELMNLKRTSKPSETSTENSKDSPGKEDRCATLNVIKLPLPKVRYNEDYSDVMPFELSLKEKPLEKFVPELIVQGTTIAEEKWKRILESDLSNSVDEAVTILANTDNWKLQVWSKERCKTTSGHGGDCTESSPLVENLLEVTLQMWNSNMSKQYCETFMEQRLMEICLKGSALAQYLLTTTDFCTIDLILSKLHLDVLDVPLLMSVASSLYPEVKQKYGLTYQ